jgi:alpha-ribazole phosphatase
MRDAAAAASHGVVAGPGGGMTTLWLWRHPRTAGAAGRCIGHTDLRVDPRRSKRLAHRVRAVARRRGLPRKVFTSSLARCHAVGAWLGRWGWQHLVDDRLLEINFGSWEGRDWSTIDEADIGAWSADLLHHAPGGGEPLRHLLERVQAFCREAPAHALVIAHAGWMQSLLLQCAAHGPIEHLASASWPAPPAHGRLLRIDLEARTPAPTMNLHLIGDMLSRDHAGGAVPSCPDSMNSPSGSNGSRCATRS